MASDEPRRLNSEETIVAIADTIDDPRPASRDELSSVVLGLFTFSSAVLIIYYVMPPARRIVVDNLLISNSEFILYIGLMYILLLITVVALGYAALRRFRILKVARELVDRLQGAKDDRGLSDAEIAIALVLSWNLIASGDFEIAARLRSLLPKKFLNLWPIRGEDAP